MQSRMLAIAGSFEKPWAGSRTGILRAAKLTAFVCFTSVAAQLALPLPFTPVPVTMQTLFVVLAGLTLGPRDGFYAMLSYVAIGAAGAPVFARFGGGPHVLLGPTGGYLAAFPLAAFASGRVSGALGGGRIAAFTGSLCGMAFVLLGGASYLVLALRLSIAGVVSLAIAPFVAGELVKALIASGLAGGRTPSGRGIL